MCWNYQVSLLFTIIYLTFDAYIFYQRPRFWKEYLVFGLFYTGMELFQTMQWLYGDVYDEDIYQKYGVPTCNITNFHYTMIAHMLIWSQPIMFAVIGIRTIDYVYGYQAVKKMLLISVFLFIYSTYSLYQKSFEQSEDMIKNSVLGYSTCTNRGETGHLVWRFRPQNIDYFVNYLMYLILCFCCFVCYDKIETVIIGVGWMVSLLVTQLVLRPTSIEIASSWCLLSVVANIIIAVFVHFTRRVD